MLDLIRDHPIIATGLATFFFGFGAGALLNLYLIAVHSPMVTELRGSLDYKSSIIGDGLLLPAVNMLIVSVLRAHSDLVTTGPLVVAAALGVGITAYFHVVQAVRGLVNWTMPEPWHWNVLGVWHAVYMFAVASLLSLFYVVSAVGVARGGGPTGFEVLAVTLGLLAFLALLRLDYTAVRWSALVPRAIARRFGHQ